MGSEGEGGGTGAKKVRKRQLVMESSDSEADEYCISTRQGAGASSAGNAGSGGQGGGDQSEETAAGVSPEKVSGAKSSDGGGSVKNKGGEPESSSHPDPKRIRVDAVHEGGGGSNRSVSKGGIGGKTLPRGFPAWRLEKPEVRAGWVLDDDGKVDKKKISDSRVKEKVLSLDDKRGKAKLQNKEQQTPLRTDQGKSVDSGDQDVVLVQGRKGLLKILPKKTTLRDNGDGKVLSEKTKVDEKTGRVPPKRGVLKLLPKKNNVMSEACDGKVRPKDIKVDGETKDGRILAKSTKVDKEISDGSSLSSKMKLDGEFGGGNVLMKNSTGASETVSGNLMKNSTNKMSKVDGETSDDYKGYKEKISAVVEPRKQDSNGDKRVMGKLISPIMLRKSDPSVVGVSLGQKMKPQNPKLQPKVSAVNQHKPSLSGKDDHTKSSKHGKLKKRLLEHEGSQENLSKKVKSEASDLQGTSGTLKKHRMKKPRGGPRNKLKQDLKNQIKNVLLGNGWKIELRPRKNTDYEDSVYFSPQGTGYWSITKAYEVFKKQLQNSHGHSSRLNNIEVDASNAISNYDLAMLRKNIVKRTNNKLDDAKKKSGDSRNRNSKATLVSSRKQHQNREDRVKVNRQGCGLRVRGSHDVEDNMDGYAPYEWKRTIYSWMIDLGVVSEDSKVKYMNSKGTRAMLEGKITRNGIYCGCCSKILTVTKFELHAGSKEQRPYANIFLEDGRVSLLQCLLDAWEKHTQHEKKGFYKVDPGEDPDDDTCAICGDGGDLVCCDHCTSTFHLDCLGIKMPTGEWYCRRCVCRFCGSAQEKTSSLELISCMQCSRKYHQACATRTGRDSFCTEPIASIDGFCSLGCRKIYKRLNKLFGVKNILESGFSWSVVRCFADSQAIPHKKKAQSAHCNAKAALAFSIMDECFQPHIDERSGINMIHNVVYNCGSDFSRLDFSGFYTFILERGDEVISAASVRIHGTEIAEMPFIGTRAMYRHKGMCRRLLNAIESALGLLNVRKLVIPAVPEMENTWTNAFGFKHVGPSKKQKIKLVNLLIINGTGLLEKMLLPAGTVDGQTTTMPGHATNTDGCDKTDREASGSLTSVHVSRGHDVGNDLQIKGHENPCPSTGYSAGLIPENLPPLAEENEVKRTLGRTSPLSVAEVKLNTIPAVDCEDNVQMKSEEDDIQEGKFTENNGKLVFENTVADLNHEDKSVSSHIHSLAMHATVDADPYSLSYDEIGKGESCPSSEPVQAALITDKTKSNLNIKTLSACSANEEDERSFVVPVVASSVTMNGKPDNHDLKTVTDGHIKSSTEAKGSNNITIQVNGTSSTGEECSASAVDNAVSMNGYVQQRETMKDQTDPLSPELEHSSMNIDVMEKLNESKSVETNDATIKLDMKHDGFNDAGTTTPTLNISNEVCDEVMAKSTLNCGGSQLHGVDGIHTSGMEKGLASKEPVNA